MPAFPKAFRSARSRRLGQGVAIIADSNPTLRRNLIYRCMENGIWIHSGGQGVLEDNEIFENRRADIVYPSNNE